MHWNIEEYDVSFSPCSQPFQYLYCRYLTVSAGGDNSFSEIVFLSISKRNTSNNTQRRVSNNNAYSGSIFFSIFTTLSVVWTTFFYERTLHIRPFIFDVHLHGSSLQYWNSTLLRFLLSSLPHFPYARILWHWLLRGRPLCFTSLFPSFMFNVVYFVSRPEMAFVHRFFYALEDVNWRQGWSTRMIV